MLTRPGLITLLILVLVVAVAGWSRLRYVGQAGYDEPQRWPVAEHPALRREPGPDRP
jgi:hypothetical protein